jgi:pentatricopeptide repeat protein
VGVPDGDVIFQAQVLTRVRGSKQVMTAPIYNTLIQCMYNNLELERIMDTLDEMKTNNITPEKSSFESAMRLALRFEDAPTALSILEEMEKFNMVHNGNQNLYLQILRCATIAEEVGI